MDEPEIMSQAQVASHTLACLPLAYLRRLDLKVDALDKRFEGLTTQLHHLAVVMLRHEDCSCRIERGVAGGNADPVLIEEEVRNRTNELFEVTQRLGG